MLDVIILAGEESGDLHGASLISALLEKNPSLKIGAVAGPRMRQLPILTLFPMEKLQVMGFIDVFLALPQLVRHFFTIHNLILEHKPKAVICIDYPGMHLRLARSLRKKGFKGLLIHYICPSVWAWGKKRIPLMEKNLDLLLTFFPFEKPLFPSLHVEHIGHPLVAKIPSTTTPKENILAIFPGSRTREIEKNLPLQMAVAKELQKKDLSLQIAISISHANKEKLIRNIAQNFSCLYVEPENGYLLMQKAKMALATSGTVTLELALHNTPTIVQYFVRPFDCFLAQKIFRIQLAFYCIVNILAQKKVFPEFFGPHLTLQNLYNEALELWGSEEKRAECVRECMDIRKLLKSEDASANGASWILKRMASSKENA